MASRSLYAPTVESFQPAFSVVPGGENVCKIRFNLSRLNGTQDFSCVHATVRKQDSGLSAVEPTGLRETGIILDIPFQKDDEGFYIEIKDSDIKKMSSNSNYSGWVPGYKYKVQLRLSEISYGETNDGLTQYQWINKYANRFSEWSTICIIKATGRFRIQVPLYNQYDSLEEIKDKNEQNELYVDNLNFLGSFISEDDKSESLKSYQIDIYRVRDGQEYLIDSSGVISADEWVEEQETQPLRYNPKREFTQDAGYIIRLTYETINYYSSSLDFNVFYNPSFTSGLDIRVLSLENDEPYGVEDNRPEKTGHKGHNTGSKFVDGIMASVTNLGEENDDARVALMLYVPGNNTVSTNIIVQRSSSKDNFTIWEDIKIFNFVDEAINPTSKGEALQKVFYDNTIESGVFYKYNTVTEDEYGNRSDLYTDADYVAVVRYFESAYLLGEDNRQLMLKFDNTVTSLKPTVSEMKTDTLGGKYPVFSRNGMLNYKTFPIGGLVSLHMDENRLFTSPADLYGDANGGFQHVISLHEGQEGVYGADLKAYNYEKDFREKVLEFLNDGKVKLYKSYSEGNVLVRLTDINFTPKQELGRLVYAFTATATEIDDCTYENCLKYNLSSLGSVIKNFAKEVYKLGQIYGLINTKSAENPGDNIIEKIYERYDFSGQNMAGQLYTVIDIVGLKLTIHDKPLSTDKGIKGFKILHNGNPIYVTSPVGVYEFDVKIPFEKTDSLYICIDEENYLTAADVSVDFVYSLRYSKFKGKQIKTKTEKRGIGQLHDYIKPSTSLFTLIYNRYYFESENNKNSAGIHFRRLNNLRGICIEANPGSVFNLQPKGKENKLEQFTVGPTGIMNFDRICDIEKLSYVGWLDSEGNVVNKGTDVILDYYFYTVSGTYQEEDA